MSKKRRKEALNFLCDNYVIRSKFRIALGLDPDMGDNEVRQIIKFIVNDYYDHGPRDSFSMISGGLRSVHGGKSLKGVRLDNEDFLNTFDSDDDDDYDKRVKRKRQSIPDFLLDLNNKD